MNRRIGHLQINSRIGALFDSLAGHMGKSDLPLVTIPRDQRGKGPQRLVLHVGAHKTGTSSLQRLLQHLGADLAKQGVFAFGRHIPRTLSTRPFGKNGYEQLIRPHLRSMRVEVLGSDACEAACRNFVEVIEGAAMGAPTIVYSDEYTLGHRVRNSGGLYPDAERQLRTLQRIFPGRKLEVILYVRAQDSYVEACYLQDIKDGTAERSFAQYLAKRVDLSALSWLDLADRVADIVGPDCLHVERFERIKEGGFVPFARRFLSHFSDPTHMEIENIAANPSLSAEGAELALRIRAKVSRQRWARYRVILMKDFSSKKGQPAVYFSEQQRRSLLNSYLGDCEAAERKYSRQ